MGVELFVAATEEDRDDIYRFRYSVYVEELGRYRSVADHERRRLVEPEDAHSVVYGARQGGRVVGTGRLTFGADGFSDRQLEQYSLRPFLAEVPAELMAIGERLMVAPDLRGSTVSAQLREFQQRDARARGALLGFGDCEPHLLSLYLSAGARTYADRNINSAEAGYLIPLMMIEDADELAGAIGYTDDAGRLCLPPALEAALAAPGAVRSADFLSPEEYWGDVERALERLGGQSLHAFADMDEQEIKESISRSNIIGCAAGDVVLKEGGSSHNLFVVLEGTLEVRHRGHLLDVLQSGDVFGEMAFLLQLPRQSDVVAATPGVRILSMSDHTFRTLTEQEPVVASKLLLNIARMLCGRLIKANGLSPV